jgi:hypothetical protein
MAPALPVDQRETAACRRFVCSSLANRSYRRIDTEIKAQRRVESLFHDRGGAVSSWMLGPANEPIYTLISGSISERSSGTKASKSMHSPNPAAVWRRGPLSVISLPSHSELVRINVCCFPSDQIADKSRMTRRARSQHFGDLQACGVLIQRDPKIERVDRHHLDGPSARTWHEDHGRNAPVSRKGNSLD